jgi:hypothetical protein
MVIARTTEMVSWTGPTIEENGDTFLFSKEGFTQGDPLSMCVYGIGLFPLIRILKESFPVMDQTWYADDAGADGKFDFDKVVFQKASRNRSLLRLLSRAIQEHPYCASEQPCSLERSFQGLTRPEERHLRCR